MAGFLPEFRCLCEQRNLPNFAGPLLRGGYDRPISPHGDSNVGSNAAAAWPSGDASHSCSSCSFCGRRPLTPSKMWTNRCATFSNCCPAQRNNSTNRITSQPSTAIHALDDTRPSPITTKGQVLARRLSNAFGSRVIARQTAYRLGLKLDSLKMGRREPPPASQKEQRLHIRPVPPVESCQPLANTREKRPRPINRSHGADQTKSAGTAASPWAL